MSNKDSKDFHTTFRCHCHSPSARRPHQPWV